MAKTVALAGDFVDLEVAGAAPAKPTFLQRFYAAMIKSRQRAAEREIERFICMRGGVLTDDLEREIGRRFGQMPNG